MKLNISDNIIETIYTIYPRQWYLRLDMIPFIIGYIYLLGWWLGSADSNDKVINATIYNEFHFIFSSLSYYHYY